MFDKHTQENIFVISGPSGVGKDTIMEEISVNNPKVHIAITATTRPPRTNEINGVNHFFYSSSEFKNLIDNDDLLEWAFVYNNYYGVPKSEIYDHSQHKIFIRVDVQGARRLKEILTYSTFVFIMPESPMDLKQRLQHRHENSDDDIEKRLNESKIEINEKEWFDFIIVNKSGKLSSSVNELTTLLGF
jgi:guanylate kinase